MDARYAHLISYDINKLKISIPSHFPIIFHFPSKFKKTMRCFGNI